MMKIMLLIFAISTLISTPSFAGEHEQKHFSHHGQTGPANWGDFSEICAKGKAQSPINIVTSSVIRSRLAPIEFHYNHTHAKEIDTGHSIRINIPKGSYVIVDGERFDLLQFHFHTPSETQINGKNLDMVAHFVHKSASGSLAVIAVLFKEGENNIALKDIWRNMPMREGEEKLLNHLEIRDIFPENKSYYYFMGSLTTPPCTENVRWYVMQSPLTVGDQQLKKINRIHMLNNRPIQSLNGRVVQGS